jgi:hypothetical protein
MSNFLIGTAQVGECLSAADTFRANFVLWSCVPLLPPSRYLLADVTLCAASGCLLSNTEAACYKYNKVEPNICMKADENLLPLIYIGRADIVSDPPIDISLGYKCELVLYGTNFCYSRLAASNSSLIVSYLTDFDSYYIKRYYYKTHRRISFITQGEYRMLGTS